MTIAFDTRVIEKDFLQPHGSNSCVRVCLTVCAELEADLYTVAVVESETSTHITIDSSVA